MSKFLVKLGVGCAAGVALYVFQYYWVQYLIFPAGGHDHLNLTLNAPLFGAILGFLTACHFALKHRQNQRLPAWISLAGGACVAMFITNYVAYAVWQGRIDGGFTTGNLLIRAIPLFAFGLLWSLALIAFGVLMLWRSADDASLRGEARTVAT